METFPPLKKGGNEGGFFVIATAVVFACPAREIPAGLRGLTRLGGKTVLVTLSAIFGRSAGRDR